jgi:DNA-directed RNA polymerase specialized sigma24 family protein
MSFDLFVETVGGRVRAGLVAAYGPDVGADASSEALAYAWEHWPRVRGMANPAGYLYRVGQSAARRLRRPTMLFPVPDGDAGFRVDPGLLPALQELSEMQRVCVVLVHGYGVSPTEAADMLQVSVSTVRTHLSRGVDSLRERLEVAHEQR